MNREIYKLSKAVVSGKEIKKVIAVEIDCGLSVPGRMIWHLGLKLGEISRIDVHCGNLTTSFENNICKITFEHNDTYVIFETKTND